MSRDTAINYFNEFGYIGVEEGGISENQNLFTAQYFMLRKILRHDDSEQIAQMVSMWLESNNGELRTKHYDDNPGFSLDELVGLCSLIEMSGHRDLYKWVPLFQYATLRPDIFFFLLRCKYPVIGFWFIWLTSVVRIYSSAQRLRRGVPTTSGKLITWLMCYTLEMKKTLWVCEKLIFSQPYYNRWSDVFAIYFFQDKHPNKLLAYEVYGE